MKHKSVSEVWKQVKKNLDKMNPEDKLRTLIDAGILTRTGQVAKPYRKVIVKTKKLA